MPQLSYVDRQIFSGLMLTFLEFIHFLYIVIAVDRHVVIRDQET